MVAPFSTRCSGRRMSLRLVRTARVDIPRDSRGSPAFIGFKARKCHWDWSSEERSNTTLGSQEWFTVWEVSALLQTVGNPATVKKIRVRHQVVLRTGSTLECVIRSVGNPCVRQACDCLLSIE